MRNPPVLLAALAGLALAGSAAGQSSVFSQAVPPDPAALERLRLRAEWTTALPLAGRSDAVGPVQVVDDTQVFVQTRSGLLVALDAATGAAQWTYQYPAKYVTLYPVAVNDRYVFAVNVKRLVCLHRYTGLVEFDFELPGQPSSGPAADSQVVYLVLNGIRVMAYRFPTLLAPPDLAARKPPAGATNQPANPADEVARRYTVGGMKPLADPPFERPTIPAANPDIPITGVSPFGRTPSISALPLVTPPYTIYNRVLVKTPSVAVLPTLRQPYQFRPDYMRYNQRTPSVAVIPPSVARLLELTNLRPRGVEPELIWSYGAPERLEYPPVLTDPPTMYAPGRVWMTGDRRQLLAVSRVDRAPQIDYQLSGDVSAPLAGPAVLGGDTLLGFVGLVNGTLVAVDLLRGSPDGPRIEWRANVGGLLDHTPVPTADAVFAAGNQTGVARVDLSTGSVVWRTDPTTNRVLAVNDEFVYARDQAGRLQVFDRRRPTDPQTRRAAPLAQLDVSSFNRPVTNARTDRIFLAADSGTMICLRDASPKYARPVVVAPPNRLPPKKDPAAADPAAPMPEDPAKKPAK
jgi:outer membrane protein assembly factor BamB